MASPEVHMNPTVQIQQMRFFLRRIGQAWCGMTPGVLPVPFIPHSADQAISAALSMVLGYYGHQMPDPGADELQYAQWGDWDLPRFLVTTARACGLDAAVTAGNITRLMEWLQQGVPVLVFPEGEIRGNGEPVAVVTGLTHDRTAVCLHYGETANLWLRLPDFLALCGGENFTAVPVSERHLATHARTRTRVRRSVLEEAWLDSLPDSLPAMAA